MNQSPVAALACLFLIGCTSNVSTLPGGPGSASSGTTSNTTVLPGGPGSASSGTTSNTKVPVFSGPVSDVRAIAKVDEPKLPGGDGKLLRLHDGLVDLGDGQPKSGKYWMFESEMQPDPSRFTLNNAVPLYMFMDKSGKKVGQNVIGVVPGDPGYSPYWRVIGVTVPDNYVPNSIRNMEDIQKALATPGFVEKRMEVAVNCPVVAEGAKLEGAEDKKADLCWYKGKRSFYFAFDTLKITNSKVPIAPIWVLMPQDSDPMKGEPNGKTTTQLIAGYDKAKANPFPFLNQDQGEGKFGLVNNIIDTWPNSDNPADARVSTPEYPEKTNYSGMWLVTRVNVPASYQFRSVTTKAGLTKEAGFETIPTTMLVNCPLLETLQR